MQNDFFIDNEINDSISPHNEQSMRQQNQNNYVGDISLNLDEKMIQQIGPGFQTTNSLNQRSSEMPSEKEKNTGSRQQKSIFHNFQKHLVITLRKNIRIRKSTCKKEPQKSVAWEIWQIFVEKTKIYTKNILHILFGVVDYEGSDLTNIYDEKIIERFGFESIFARYSEQVLTQAQDYLRSQVIKQIKKLNIKDLMKKRRLISTDEFIEYVKEFISQLEEGPMRKRLPKSKKTEMRLTNRPKLE